MDDIILKSDNVFKSYENLQKKNIEILKGISIEIIREKITVIVGASGAGKSTLLHILSGLDRPDIGKVFINDNDLFSLTDNQLAAFRNKHIGFVFQFHHLLPEFSALENVAIPLMINDNGYDKSLQKAEELITIIGLKERKDHKPAELSGGEQQRVAVARALINDPDVIFADEPTGNLDSINSDIINNLFVELRDKYKKTFIIVTHNPELMKLADYVFEMKDGKIFSR